VGGVGRLVVGFGAVKEPKIFPVGPGVQEENGCCLSKEMVWKGVVLYSNVVLSNEGFAALGVLLFWLLSSIPGGLCRVSDRRHAGGAARMPVGTAFSLGF